MTKNEFTKIRDLLYRRVGIFIDDKKFESFSRKFDRFLEQKKLSFREVFHEIRFKKSELFQEVINLVTVNETYFFREKHQFDLLINYILPELDKIRPKNDVIRILSAPCSTGEEPYSIVLYLLEEGKLLKKRDFEIVGIDIDSNALEKAKKGIFTKRSVSFLPKNILDKYFKQKGIMYEIDDFIKNVVEFKKINVFDSVEMGSIGKFDVIFSRNMLIYFNDESRRKVAMNFYKILKTKGVIFLGHAENMNRITSVFKTKRVNDVTFYAKE